MYHALQLKSIYILYFIILQFCPPGFSHSLTDKLKYILQCPYKSLPPFSLTFEYLLCTQHCASSCGSILVIPRQPVAFASKLSSKSGDAYITIDLISLFFNFFLMNPTQKCELEGKGDFQFSLYFLKFRKCSEEALICCLPHEYSGLTHKICP